MAFASEAVLTSLDAYLSRGGGSRGARAICDPDGLDVPVTRTGPLEAFQFRAERNQDRPEKIAIRFEGGTFTCSFQQIRRHDHSQAAYFERDWSEFLTGPFTRQAVGRALRMAPHPKAWRLTRFRRARTRRADVRPQCQQHKGLLAILNRQRSLGLSASSDHRGISREIPIKGRFAPEAALDQLWSRLYLHCIINVGDRR
jgi:hypothetical protein